MCDASFFYLYWCSGSVTNVEMRNWPLLLMFVVSLVFVVALLMLLVFAVVLLVFGV